MNAEYNPIRIRPPEQDAAGQTETPLSPEEARVAIREGWGYRVAPASLTPARAFDGAAA